MIGVDVVDIERLRGKLAATPRLAERLFTEAERAYCTGKGDPVVHFAGTLAAKEAVIKALDLGGSLPAWARFIEITREDSGAPRARVSRDGRHEDVSVSISHDGGVAVAVALQT